MSADRDFTFPLVGLRACACFMAGWLSGLRADLLTPLSQMGGGDLLNLLVEKDIFPEGFTQVRALPSLHPPSRRR